MFEPDLSTSDAPAGSIDLLRELQLSARPDLPALSERAGGWADQTRCPALDLEGTTPTLLPDLLRAVSKQADLLARDPVNTLDNNPYIVREWLIVSQALHAAAATIEKRFEAMFLGM